MEDKNQRPEEISNIPTITLIVLVLLILSLLYVGYGYFSDTPGIPNNEAVVEKTNDAETEISEPTVAKTEDVVTPKTKEIDKPKVEPEKPKETKKLVAEIPNGGMIIPHLVQSGETFYGIANRYNLKTDVLRALNPEVDPQSIKVGVTKLKIKIKAKHTVGPGDILTVVAKKYDISKKVLMDANKLTKDFSKRGDELIIPFK
ncbi:MAG: LysM peptidoglycan-binding domain-containing protein [Bacteroidota bacterium]